MPNDYEPHRVERIDDGAERAGAENENDAGGRRIDDGAEEAGAENINDAGTENVNDAGGRRGSWKANRSAILTGLIVAAVAGLFPPIGNWLLGAVDDLKERVRERPYWQEEPQFLPDSLHFVSGHEYSGTATVEGLNASIYLADDVAKGPLKAQRRSNHRHGTD